MNPQHSSPEPSKQPPRSLRSSAPLEAFGKSLEDFTAEALAFPEDLARIKPTERAFSATEIVYHMIAVEELWQARLARLIDGSSREFKAMDPDRVAIEGKHNELDLRVGIPRLIEKRKVTTATIAGLTDDQLDLEGIHAKYGPLNVLQIVALMEGHDKNHTNQLRRTFEAVESNKIAASADSETAAN